MSENARDLFGFTPPQGDLFANEAPRNDGVGVADPERVRARLHKLLMQAKEAKRTSPWSERDTRMYQITFPQMANWLPAAEAEQLCIEFRLELERLRTKSS